MVTLNRLIYPMPHQQYKVSKSVFSQANANHLDVQHKITVLVFEVHHSEQHLKFPTQQYNQYFVNLKQFLENIFNYEITFPGHFQTKLIEDDNVQQLQ